MEQIIAPNLLERKEGRPGGWSLWASLAGMLVLSFIVFYAVALRPASDISIHATWAAEGDFREPRSFLHHGAHPLWHGLVALVLLTGMPLTVAAALVTALLKTAELFLIHRLMACYLGDILSPKRITLGALACVMVSALCVPWYNPQVYLGVGTPNTWHSPTQMIAMVAMLLCVPYTAWCHGEFKRRLSAMGDKTLLPWKNIILLAALLLGSLLAKPSLLQAFLPAACLYFLVEWVRHPRNSRYFGQMILAALPAVLFMVVQYLYYFGIIVPSQGDMVLEVSLGKLGRVALCTLLIQAFPLYVLIFVREKGRFKDPLMALAALMDGVGVVEYLILGENGRRAADGNFGWGMMGGALMLWTMMLIAFMKSFAAYRKEGKHERKPGEDLRYGVGFGLLAWHLASGVYYLVYLLTTANPL